MKYILLLLLASCATQKIVTIKRTYYPDGSVLVSEPRRLYLVKATGDTTVICTYECENCDDLFESQ